MPNLLATSAARLASILKTSAGVSVTYQHTGITAIALTVTASDQEYEVFTEESGNTLVNVREYIATTADLTTMPRKGGRVTETIGGVVCVFEVLPVGSKPCIERHDRAGIMTVIRTKKVA